MIKYDCIIFDVDGTLTSTNELIFASFNHIMMKYKNICLSDEEIIALFGPTEEAIIRKYFPDNSKEVIEEYYLFYAAHHYMAEVYPGIRELVIRLHKERVRLAVFTGKGRRAALITLRALGLAEYFELIISGDEVEHCKPDPEGIKKILDELRLDKEKVLMIGDAPADILASHEAGIKIASAVWDSYAARQVRNMNPDHLFNSVAELSEFLGGL